LLPGGQPVVHFSASLDTTSVQIQTYPNGSMIAYPVSGICTVHNNRQGQPNFYNCLYPLSASEAQTRKVVRTCRSGVCDTAPVAEADLSCLCQPLGTGCPMALPVASTPMVLPLTDASNATAVAFSGHSIMVSWSDNSCNEQGFIIQRSLSPNGPFVEVARAIRSPYTDTNLVPLTTYFYRVVSF
jgi:hypothetical protein